MELYEERLEQISNRRLTPLRIVAQAECDPISADLGLLGCEEGLVCAQNARSALGGSCMEFPFHQTFFSSSSSSNNNFNSTTTESTGSYLCDFYYAPQTMREVTVTCTTSEMCGPVPHLLQYCYPSSSSDTYTDCSSVQMIYDIKDGRLDSFGLCTKSALMDYAAMCTIFRTDGDGYGDGDLFVCSARVFDGTLCNSCDDCSNLPEASMDCGWLAYTLNQLGVRYQTELLHSLDQTFVNPPFLWMYLGITLAFLTRVGVV